MVVAIEQLRPLTIDDLADFPDDGKRREIITGELVVTPAPTPAHQIVVGRLFKLLINFVDARALGHVMQAPVDVELSANDIVEPDIVFVSIDRLESIGSTRIVGSPDLVVEVVSPSSRRRDLVHKRALYARSEIPDYWIVDPERLLVEVLRLVDGLYQMSTVTDGVHRSVVLPGLNIDAAELFRALPGGT